MIQLQPGDRLAARWPGREAAEYLFALVEPGTKILEAQGGRG